MRSSGLGSTEAAKEVAVAEPAISKKSLSARTILC